MGLPAGVIGQNNMSVKKPRRGRFLRLPLDDLLSSGITIAALSLLAGFISLPLLSLLIWTVSSS
ncbi:MAG: hypothetical protein M3157_01765, partial [Actinomycetota bacterium]|nr:hypothetical protein [Actinomycetota bacterium]